MQNSTPGLDSKVRDSPLVEIDREDHGADRHSRDEKAAEIAHFSGY